MKWGLLKGSELPATGDIPTKSTCLLSKVFVGKTIQVSNQMNVCTSLPLNSLPTLRFYDSSIYPKCP